MALTLEVLETSLALERTWCISTTPGQIWKTQRVFKLIDHLRIAVGFAGLAGVASSMSRYPVTVTAISACTNGIPIYDVEDPGIWHIAVFSWRATAKLLLQLIASRRTESADRICSDLTR